ncbi:NRAMP (natural resistance-associated macrophage protein)-like metal ion transporter [Rhizobium brockwellii]
MDALNPNAKNGWRHERGEASLSDVYRTVGTGRHSSTWRRAAAFAGPGYMVAVGYMDPGNWATSLAGGSKFGYALLTVALLSNLMAIVLQSLCARLAIASGRDLAQACRDAFPKYVSLPLWAFAEIAIIATDIAEVIGTAIGLNLLMGIPLELGVLITALDVFVILFLQKLGFRWVEAFIIALLGVIAVCFGVQILLADPQWGAVLTGFFPTTEIVTNPEMLYLALGILGATVMPHNLYLHSGIVQTRAYGHTVPEKREALTFATIDSTVALCFALLINASILILAAAAFNAHGKTDVVELGDAYSLLSPLLGLAIAPTLFGIALLCCGLNSTVTADACRPDRHGRLPEDPAEAVGAPLDYPGHRHRAGSDRHHLVWRSGHGGAFDPHPSGAQPAAFLRRLPAGDVYRQQGQDGRTRGAALAEWGCLSDRDRHRRAERQAALRLRHRLNQFLEKCGASLKPGVGRPAIVEIIDERGELVAPHFVHDDGRPQRQPRPRSLDRCHQDPHGVFTLTRMNGGDLDAAEAPTARRDDLGDRLRPGDQRQLPAWDHDGAGGSDPAFEQVVGHRMGFGLQRIRRAPVAGVVKGRVHDDVVEALIDEAGIVARLGGQRHIGLDDANPVGDMGILGQEDAAAGIIGHLGRALEKHHVRIGEARGDGKAGSAGAGAEIGNPDRAIVGDERRKQHGIHAGAMAPALRLHHMEAAAMKGIDGVNGFPGHRSSLPLAQLTAETGIGEDAARLIGHLLIHQQAAR